MLAIIERVGVIHSRFSFSCASSKEPEGEDKTKWLNKSFATGGSGGLHCPVSRIAESIPEMARFAPIARLVENAKGIYKYSPEIDKMFHGIGRKIKQVDEECMSSSTERYMMENGSMINEMEWEPSDSWTEMSTLANM